MKKPVMTPTQIATVLGDLDVLGTAPDERIPKEISTDIQLAAERIARDIYLGRAKVEYPPSWKDSCIRSTLVYPGEEINWNYSYENGQKRLLGYTITKKP